MQSGLRLDPLEARCYSSEGRLPYAPIAAWLKSDALQSTLVRLDAPSLTDVARLRPEIVATRPDIPAPDRELESWQRLRFFEALAQTFRSEAGHCEDFQHRRSPDHFCKVRPQRDMQVLSC